MTKMQNKKLLEESRVLRWGKLAGISPLAENFVKETFHADEEVDEVKTKEQSRSGGAPDRLDENPMDAEMAGDDMGGSEMDPAGEPEMAPSGDEPATEATVKDLIAALASTMTDVTGVAVEVEGAEGDEGGEEMDMGSDEMAPEEPETGGEEEMMEVADEDLEEVNDKDEQLNEEASPVGAKTTSSSMNNPPSPKKTSQGDIGKVKDPMKGEVRVKGAEKPKQVEGAHPDHKYKPLEEQLYKKFVARLFQEVKAAKLKKEAIVPAASPANVPARRVVKPAITTRVAPRPVVAKPTTMPVAENKTVKKK